MNYQGSIQIRVTHTGSDTTLARIIKLMEDAQGKKAPISKLADTACRVLCTGSAGDSCDCGDHMGADGALCYIRADRICIRSRDCLPVCIRSCNTDSHHGWDRKRCQLWNSGKSGEALEMMHKVDAVVLDKTGTITKGKPQVVEIITKDMEEDEMLTIAASCEQASEHPLALAIVEEGKKAQSESDAPGIFRKPDRKGTQGRTWRRDSIYRQCQNGGGASDNAGRTEREGRRYCR